MSVVVGDQVCYHTGPPAGDGVLQAVEALRHVVQTVREAQVRGQPLQ